MAVYPAIRPFRCSLPCLLAASLAVCLVPLAHLNAQGLLIVHDHPHPVPLPRPIIHPVPQPPPTAYKIKELTVNARLIDQIAKVQVAQSFVNTGSRQMQVQFVFPLPYDGAIDALTLLVDGKEYPAKLLTKEKAREIYEGFIRQNQDPALLEWMGTGMFQTSVFPVPPGAERKVTITYKQLLRQDRHLTDFLFPLGTAKYTSAPIEKVEIQVHIEGKLPIKSVYSPTHAVEVQRPDPQRAVVTYKAEKIIPSGDFRLFCDVDEALVGASVISYRPQAGEDGYFLLLASPDVNWSADNSSAKNVVCVFDRSGSMSGTKFEQARQALRYVINNLREGDYFNLIAYDTEVEAFQGQLQPFDDTSRKEALGFVNSLYAGGGTNIDGALQAALRLLDRESQRPSYILFMSDGRPTIGESHEAKIVKNAREKNMMRARMISFGVGYDVNSRLLDRLSHACFGASHYVRPNENIENHVARLYNKIRSPVMTDVTVTLDVDVASVQTGDGISRVYPRQINDLFEGEQVVLIGRYRTAGKAKVRIRGTIGGEAQTFAFPAQLVESSGDEKYAFVEKVWALRRMGQILDDLDLHGRNEELIQELVQLSMRHGILTPYTSFLADDQGGRHELAEAHQGRGGGARRAAEALHALDEAEGRIGFLQRDLKRRWSDARQVPANAPVASIAPGRDGATLYSLEDDREISAAAVRNVGNRSIYRRGKFWIAANCTDLDPEKDKNQFKRIKRFGDEYFALVRASSKADNEILARQRPGEQLLIRIQGQAYHLYD
ncbi:MAG: VWA domain-containing protein [Planctomycetales bacterium]|nr:VWA domain-containing protein [Planctomycetales bacterium]NIO35476.1 VWA domain-containing protein [Planctomycetales bacterium]